MNDVLSPFAIKFNVAQVKEIIPKIKELAENHHEEVKDFPVNLAMDWSTYEEWETAKSLVAFTAHHEETLIGYASMFIFENHHYNNQLEATQDAIYIAPKFRGCGPGFISFIDQELQARGVKASHQHVKINHDWSKTLIKVGYQPTETTYTKKL